MSHESEFLLNINHIEAPITSNGFTIRTVTSQDCVGISSMIRRNFEESSTYANIPENVRQQYIDYNSPEGVWRTCSNPNNIVALVVNDGQGQVVGYIVVRKVEHKIDGEPVAGIRRMHIAREFEGQGFGRGLITATENLVKNAGFNRIVVNASGESNTFFSHMGYSELSRMSNRTFSQQGIQTNMVYMQKHL